MAITFTEELILEKIISDNGYFLDVFPYLNADLFENEASKLLFKYLKIFNDTYDKQPTNAIVNLTVEKLDNKVSNLIHKDLLELKDRLTQRNEADSKWLKDETLNWIRKRSYCNALVDGIKKYDSGKIDPLLPDRLNDALGISFDNNIGMKFSNPEERWEKYTSEEEKIQFGLPILNSITRNGITKGSINLVQSSSTGGYKSGTLVQFSCDYLRQGKNVLYISMEMSPEKVMERIDANLLDVEIDNLTKMGKQVFISKVQDIKNKTFGEIIVKQYPTCGASVNNFRQLLKDLKLVQGFVPDVIMVDYLNICASSRYKAGVENTYGYVKAISEELRGLAIEEQLPIWTATQSNRSGEGNENLSLTDISDSYGVAFTADFILGIITTQEYDNQNKILFKQLKNRYDDPNKNKIFFMGVNKAKMKLYDLSFEDIDIQVPEEDDDNTIQIKKKKTTIF